MYTSRPKPVDSEDVNGSADDADEEGSADDKGSADDEDDESSTDDEGSHQQKCRLRTRQQNCSQVDARP